MPRRTVTHQCCLTAFLFPLCFFLSWFPCFSSQKAYISRSFRLAHARPIHRKSAAHTHERCLNMLLSLWLFLTLSLLPLLEFWCVRSHWLEVFFSTIYFQCSVPYIKVPASFRYINRSIGFILTLILLLCQVTCHTTDSIFIIFKCILIGQLFHNLNRKRGFCLKKNEFGCNDKLFKWYTM